MGDDFETLKLRVARLETQNRRCKQAGSLAAVLLLTALVLGQTKPAKQIGVSDVVRARRFILVDADGGLRGLWDTIDGGAYLSLYHKNTDLMSALKVDSEGGSLLLEAHNTNVLLEAKGERCRIRLAHGSGHRVQLNAREAGAALGIARIISVKNSLVPGPSLGMYVNPSPSIVLDDKNGKTRMHFSVDPYNFIVLQDKNEKPRAVLGAWGGTMTVRTGVEHKYPESSLLLFDKDGTVLLEAP